MHHSAKVHRRILQFYQYARITMKCNRVYALKRMGKKLKKGNFKVIMTILIRPLCF